MRARASAVLLACIGVALVLGAVARSAAMRGPSFAPAKSYATGEGPDSLAASDLNGDGRPDLVTANHSPNTVSVLLNRGRGRFEGKRDYGTGTHPYLRAAADLNGDGKPDLMTVNDGTVSVLLSRGDGSFEPRRDYTIGDFMLELADVNGDGRPDLVTANSEASTVSVHLNRGDGSFQAKRDYATGRGTGSLAVADLSGDGSPDLVTANSDAKTVSVLVNRGDGSFEPKRDYATARFPGRVAIHQLNGDGRPDIVTGNVGSISVLLNRGDGSFRRHSDYPTCRRCFPQSEEPPDVESVVIADLNRDGKPDVATRNLEALPHEMAVGSVSVFLNRGNGTFKAEHSYRTGRPEEALSGWLALVDLNGDGTPDLVTEDLGERPHLRVQVNRGDGSFGSRFEYRIGVEPGPSVVADLNGDRKQDVAAANDLGASVSVPAEQTRSLQCAVRQASDPGRREAGARARQLPRGKGRPSSVESQGRPRDHAEAKVRRRAAGRWEGQPRRQQWAQMRAPVSGVLLAFIVVALALVGVAGSSAGRTPSFAAAKSYPTGKGPTPVVADLNGDGKPDLVTSNGGADTSPCSTTRATAVLRPSRTTLPVLVPGRLWSPT